MQGAQYEDAYPSRMIKLGPNTRFEGKIHEFLAPYELPKKEFNDFVHHYGYVYKNEEEKKKHAWRNIVPLLEMRKEHPGDPRWMCQLAQEYFSIGDYDEVFRVCKEGLEEWAGMDHDFIYAPSHIGALYGFLLSALELSKHYEEEEEWLQRAFEDSNMKLDYMEPNLAFFCLSGAKLYVILKDYGRSRDYFRRYVDYAKRLKDNRDMMEAGTALIVSSVFQETFLYGIVLSCMEAAIRMEDTALAEEAFYMLDWQDWRLLNQHECERGMVDACCSVAYHPVWVKLLQTLVSRPQGMREMLVVFLEREIEYKQQGESGREKLSRLHRLVAELDYEHRYVLYGKILWAEENPAIASKEERRKKIEVLFEELFAKYQGEILEVKPEIWDVAQRQKIFVGSLLMKIEYRSFRQMLERWCAAAALWEVRQWEEMLESWKAQFAEACERDDAVCREKYLLRYRLFLLKCQEGILRRCQEVCPSLEQLEKTLWQYADSALALYEPCYEEFVFKEMPEALPDEAQLALLLKDQRRCREEGNDLKALEYTRKCLGVCPAVEEAVELYAKMYRDEIQRRDREADAARSELNCLIATLKKTAERQIENGEYESAREILLQVRQCAPEDADVQRLLQSLGQ